MKISMIAAMTPDRVIGKEGGGIPWHGKLPRDQQHFRSYTEGKWMLLGRATFEEMDGWFTTQTPVVLTSDPSYRMEKGYVVTTVNDAIELARSHHAEELVVSGGASVYEVALGHAETLVLTLVEADVESSRLFPEWDSNNWRLVSERCFPADEANAFAMRFQEFRRN